MYGMNEYPAVLRDTCKSLTVTLCTLLLFLRPARWETGGSCRLEGCMASYMWKRMQKVPGSVSSVACAPWMWRCGFIK